ncbi:hypothetical protein PHJA_001975800 [Phtheirospermum japonicum]|uniref:Uncharacterized protein n=1 Tax=Phtheirospermum japonicum TaxID=374723 RepID=A0A830CGW4_9LAMI|nr:hypothetical protein PHJA_001975800 [Phtheirospermum japonicum]
MNSKNSQLRPFGQRSITSTLLFRAASNRDCERDVETKVSSGKGSRASLSDFLNRKLHRSSVLPTSVQEKELPFSSPNTAEQSERGANGESVKKEGREAETKFSIDGAFNMFKNIERDKTDSKNSLSANETDIFYVDDIQQKRKRKNLNEGHDNKPTAQKRLVVLGEDSKPVQRSRTKKIAKEEPIPLFNHYKNGSGWWNDSMEGVDNEEVGCNDVWEGVGCTTLGGIEWH